MMATRRALGLPPLAAPAPLRRPGRAEAPASIACASAESFVKPARAEAPDWRRLEDGRRNSRPCVPRPLRVHPTWRARLNRQNRDARSSVDLSELPPRAADIRPTSYRPPTW